MNAKWSNEELLLGVQGNSFCICDKHTLNVYLIENGVRMKNNESYFSLLFYRDSNFWEEFYSNC